MPVDLRITHVSLGDLLLTFIVTVSEWWEAQAVVIMNTLPFQVLKL